MSFRDFALGFLVIAPIVLIVSLVVTYLYGLIAHGSGIADWEASVRFAIILGIALPVIRQLDKKKA